MADYPLSVIPEPEPGTASVMVGPDDEPEFVFVSGEGDANLLCGKCGNVLGRGLASRGQVTHVVLKCPRCGSYNQA